MLTSLLISIGAITGMAVLWVIVQSLWRETFKEYIHDDDVLAERRSCNNCGCTTACENKLKETSTL